MKHRKTLKFRGDALILGLICGVANSGLRRYTMYYFWGWHSKTNEIPLMCMFLECNTEWADISRKIRVNAWGRVPLCHGV